MNTAVASCHKGTALANDLSGIMPANAAFLAKPRKLLIDGAWVPAASGQTFEVRDPSSDRVILSTLRTGRCGRRGPGGGGGAPCLRGRGVGANEAGGPGTRAA